MAHPARTVIAMQNIMPVFVFNPFPCRLTKMLKAYILTHTILHVTERIAMRTTLNLEDRLLNEAADLTGIREKTALVRLSLEALVTLERSKRLAKLGGTEKGLEATPRRGRGGHSRGSG